MNYEHFSVTGGPTPYPKKSYPDSAVQVAIIRLDPRLSLGHVKTALGRISGCRVIARWSSSQKDGHITLCGQASSMSKQDITDLLGEIDLLLDGQMRAIANSQPLADTTRGQQRYRNRPVGLR